MRYSAKIIDLHSTKRYVHS